MLTQYLLERIGALALTRSFTCPASVIFVRRNMLLYNIATSSPQPHDNKVPPLLNYHVILLEQYVSILSNFDYLRINNNNALYIKN